MWEYRECFVLVQKCTKFYSKGKRSWHFEFCLQKETVLFLTMYTNKWFCLKMQKFRILFICTIKDSVWFLHSSAVEIAKYHREILLKPFGSAEVLSELNAWTFIWCNSYFKCGMTFDFGIVYNMHNCIKLVTIFAANDKDSNPIFITLKTASVLIFFLHFVLVIKCVRSCIAFCWFSLAAILLHN